MTPGQQVLTGTTGIIQPGRPATQWQPDEQINHSGRDLGVDVEDTSTAHIGGGSLLP
jgi:hypothetical protein